MVKTTLDDTKVKKSTIIQLIRCHVEHNDPGFRQAAREAAEAFDKAGDEQLALYIMGLVSGNGFVPQDNHAENIPSEVLPEAFFEQITPSNSSLLLPDPLMEDIQGIIQAVSKKRGLHRFLFQGAPGTGKTESVRHLGRLLRRDIYLVNFAHVIDSRLGQSQKNLSEVFEALNRLQHPERVIVFFDELDALAMDRGSAQDLREMGRLTSGMLKQLDALNPEVLLFAATNLYAKLDPALTRRFDAIINFDQYGPEELLSAADKILDDALAECRVVGRNKRLFHKILQLLPTPLMPGELKPLIRRAVAFSDESVELDYLRRLYIAVMRDKPLTLPQLQDSGFTMREIECLTGVSKSRASRILAEI